MEFESKITVRGSKLLLGGFAILLSLPSESNLPAYVQLAYLVAGGVGKGPIEMVTNILC